MAERRGHPELVTYADLGIDPVGRGYAPARAGDRGGQQPPVPVGQQVVDDGVVEHEQGEGELGGVADATG